MAHLGARQTEDLEVAGSSPACPITFFLLFFCCTLSAGEDEEIFLFVMVASLDNIYAATGWATSQVLKA